MALTAQQLEILHLGGTVTIPAALPCLGRIRVDGGILRIDEVVQGKRVARTVFLQDVVAVFIPTDPKSPDFNFGVFHYVPNISAQTLQSGDGSVLGIVYVNEHARVLVEASSTAAESENFVTSMAKYWGCN